MKTIAIYGVQAGMGLVALAAGYAKLAGADFMVDAFAALGLGTSVRVLAGSIEILGGLCLLMPRAGVVGAMLLASVVVGTAGMTVGQIASQMNNPAPGVVTTYKAMQSDRFNTVRPTFDKYQNGIDI